MNFQIDTYYNALRPEYGPTSQLRTQVTLIFLSGWRQCRTKIRSLRTRGLFAA